MNDFYVDLTEEEELALAAKQGIELVRCENGHWADPEETSICEMSGVCSDCADREMQEFQRKNAGAIQRLVRELEDKAQDEMRRNW